MTSSISARADFSFIRYAQCWEDADVLNTALNVKSGDTCLSIASAGDNSLSLLAHGPARVIALDLNPAQLACLELRVAAYRELDYNELLGLIGSRPHPRRRDLYQRCRALISRPSRDFWDSHGQEIDQGIGSAGKFERYFTLFRRRIMPLIHNRTRIARLFEKKSPEQRESFYQHTWNNWRWRLLFKLFFSRFVMGRMGRDPRFFDYVEGSVADRILGRTRHALVKLDPSENPYLYWILNGTHGEALPLSLREDQFEAIRSHIDRIEWHQLSLEDYLLQNPDTRIDCYNLSDIFEYMSVQDYHQLLQQLIAHANPGARLAYWNMLAPRSRPDSLANKLESRALQAQTLHLEDKAFSYSRFVLEVVRS